MRMRQEEVRRTRDISDFDLVTKASIESIYLTLASLLGLPYPTLSLL